MEVVDHFIIGAGPAGLTAAYKLAHNGHSCIVLEEENQVGGISKTVTVDGWRFDLGGHRFFSKDKSVNDFWNEILGKEDFLDRPRLSRILYKGRFFAYPLKPFDALRQLGILESLKCGFSFIACKISPPKDQSNFEGWVAARFGWRLYRTFFKTYTEKVWGVDATEIQADWAAQRIKSLSIWKAVREGLKPSFMKRELVTTLISTFKYPKLGPGMMWERCAEKVVSLGGKIIMNEKVVSLEKFEGGCLVTSNLGNKFLAKNIYSTMPINILAKSLLPNVPSSVLESANSLKHRDFLTVAVVLNVPSPFPDNWIYIHTPEVKVGRIQNFGSWSPFLVRDGMSCLGLEYFLNETDDMWSWDDSRLLDLAKAELDYLGLVDPATFVSGYVVRVPKAYPVYDEGYTRHVNNIRQYLQDSWPSIYPMGRNGMHRYNNQDHSMLTAMLSVENAINGGKYDVWSVNLDDDYHEEVKGEAAKGTGRLAPVFFRR